MKWKCEICNVEYPCILEIYGEWDRPNECPFGYVRNISEWEEVNTEDGE